MVRKLKDQAKRYTEALGPGAVVFAAGASEGVKNALEELGVIALDGSGIPLVVKSPGPKWISGPRADFWSLHSSETTKPQVPTPQKRKAKGGTKLKVLAEAK